MASNYGLNRSKYLTYLVLLYVNRVFHFPAFMMSLVYAMQGASFKTNGSYGVCVLVDSTIELFASKL